MNSKEIMRGCAVSVFRRIKALTGYVPPENIFKHLHFTGPFTIQLPNGTSVTQYSWGNRVENELAWRGWDGHEPIERQRWASIVAAGGDILDIGANTGTYAILAKAISPSSRVFAFEPLGRVAERIQKNSAISGLDISVICAALARETGELPIYDPGGENAYSASLDANFLKAHKDSYQVPAYSLDEFCLENEVDPIAIKLDVEGYEGEVICGGEKILSRGRCVIICEWLGSAPSHLEAQSLLSDNGYVALNMFDLSRVDLSDTKEFEERNVLLVHRNKAPAILNT